MKSKVHGGINAFRQTTLHLQKFMRHLHVSSKQSLPYEANFWKPDFRNYLFVDYLGRLKEIDTNYLSN